MLYCFCKCLRRACCAPQNPDPNVYDEITPVEPCSIPLIKYAQLISEALRGKFFASLSEISKRLILSCRPIDSPQILEMRTECKVHPVYSPTDDVTCGYVVPNCQLLARVAPPVPDDAMR